MIDDRGAHVALGVSLTDPFLNRFLERPTDDMDILAEVDATQTPIRVLQAILAVLPDPAGLTGERPLLPVESSP